MMEKKTFIIPGVSGKDILADYRKVGEDAPLLIFCHGFKGFKDWGHFNLLADFFAESGLNVLKFNFSYNGGTMEQPIDFPDLDAFGNNNYLKEVEDLNQVIHLAKIGALKDLGQHDEIFILGHSRGGGIVNIVASENAAVKKVVSWAGVSDFVERLPERASLDKWREDGVVFIKNGRTNQDMPMYYQFVDALLQNGDRLSIKKAVKKIQIPQLIIHGTWDETVELEEALVMHTWNPNAEIFPIVGANHVFGGKHPWEENKLPTHSVTAATKTINFLNAK